MMTRSDFEAVAKVVASMLLTPQARRHVAERLGEFCLARNPRFNPMAWHAACGTLCKSDYDKREANDNAKLGI